ncbi:MAG TPA: sporulation protein YunB [Candidatus Avoscillospira stercorigallinarum]|uniref:Sporulation protein YunB n=1 Tax=Candidatus Avoscillospira stercorigallinarum TaxID=2840708 RepID=A0A9D1CN52_9FIRM|nr:sporulation protein YunB [Candidatus Avoscillospira stercorigallinarum]
MRLRRHRGRMLAACLLLLLAACLLFLRLTVGPLVQELAKAIVSNKASNIINEAVEAQLRSDDIDYDSIIYLEKDYNGAVTALKTNINEINRLKTEILSVIDTMLLELDVNEVGLPLGSLILPEFFSGTGPTLPVKVLSVSTSDADFHNEFAEAGINQTSHRIYMEVRITMTILTPVGTEAVTASSTVVVAETVIVGTVPGSYVDVKTGTE